MEHLNNMKRICVLSTDANPGYWFYLPIVAYYWQKFGWEVRCFMTRNVEGECLDMILKTCNDAKLEFICHTIPDIEGVRPNTLAQTVRHFVADVLPRDAYWQVQDIDLIPLKPWEPDLNARTVWGFPEMTGGTFVPVHYTGMTGDKWYDLMGCTGDLKADMERELKRNGRAYKEKWEDYWDTDWDILTQKILPRRDEFTWVPRGMVSLGRHTVPRGRVDRSSIEVGNDNSYSWGATRNQAELIDCHCENHNPSSPEKWKNIKSLLMQVFKEVPAWMDVHATEHYKKYGVH